MEPGLGAAFGATGVTWGKTRLEAFEWGATQPVAPGSSGPDYDWTCTDADVREYQAAGIRQLQSYLSPRSAWGSVDIDSDIMPKAEYEADYVAWVGALIERYDGDGVEDMPGLLAPIRYWVVGPEWTGFWPTGDADDYLALLEMTREAALSAYPEVLLGTIPFLLLDVFHGNEPTDEQIAARLSEASPIGRHTPEGIYAILDRPDLFDYVCVHSLGDYTEIPQTLRWFRSQMAQRGYGKPIWLDDAFPMSNLANITWPIVYPLMSEAEREPVLEALRAVARPSDVGHAAAQAWIRALAARGTVQKVITALGEGAVGIQLGNTEDWMHDFNEAIRVTQVNFIGAAAMMGAIDVSHGDGSLPNYAHCVPRTPGAPRPAHRNLTLLAARIGDGAFTAIEPLSLSGGARGYRFERDGTWWICAWREDDVLQLPGESETPENVTLPIPAGTTGVNLLWAVTQSDTPTTDSLAVMGGNITVPLTSTPVFVHPVPTPP